MLSTSASFVFEIGRQFNVSIDSQKVLAEFWHGAKKIKSHCQHSLLAEENPCAEAQLV
jgi:hypothetical protein